MPNTDALSKVKSVKSFEGWCCSCLGDGDGNRQNGTSVTASGKQKNQMLHLSNSPFYKERLAKKFKGFLSNPRTVCPTRSLHLWHNRPQGRGGKQHSTNCTLYKGYCNKC